MTPVQAQTLPYILAEKDLIAQPKTNSGKIVTLILERLDVMRSRIHSWVFSWTSASCVVAGFV